jgi:NAD(P)H-dependent FMN reductase
MTKKILAFAGSLRKDSWHKKLVKVILAGAKNAGAEVTFINLEDYELPLFNEDKVAEFVVSERNLKFRELLKSHDGFIIGTPEYNSAITPALKNAIDWASVPVNGEEGLVTFKGKFVALVSGSAGGFGGIRGLPITRLILSNIGAHVISDQMAVPKVTEKFDASGNITDEKLKSQLEALGKQLVDLIK